MFLCGLVELLSSNIASVFTKSFLEGSVTFSNVLFAAVDARDAINNIKIEALLQTPTPSLTFVKKWLVSVFEYLCTLVIRIVQFQNRFTNRIKVLIATIIIILIATIF